ncbi:MAG: hypothetical protein QOG43_689, partial [Actinomycetota bacterium]|nr:hypothetical protein [Actinomycetota bacterium]
MPWVIARQYGIVPYLRMASAREKRPGVWEMRQSLGRDPVTGKARSASRTVYTTSARVLDREKAKFQTEVGAAGRTVVPKEAATVGQLLDRYIEHITDGKTVEQLAAEADPAAVSP